MSAPLLNAIDPRIVTPPPGLEFDNFKNADGASIRHAMVPPAAGKMINGKPVGVAVVVTGFRESIERYFELMRDLSERGYAVHAMDWRGQGGSQRYNPDLPQRPNAQGYENDVADLSQFVTEVIKPKQRYGQDAPVTLFAHSMGGNLALRYLHEHQDQMDAAVITAPMMQIRTGWMPPWAARQISKIAEYFGAGDRYLPGTGDWHERELKNLQRINCNREIRQNLQTLFYRDMPENRMGGPTFAWLREAFRSIAIVRDPKFLSEIRTPIFLATAGRDKLVSTSATHKAAKHLPNVQVEHFKDGLHSLWMEHDSIRDRLWNLTDRFLNRTLGIPIPVPNTTKDCCANDNACTAPASKQVRLPSGPEHHKRPAPPVIDPATMPVPILRPQRLPRLTA